MPVAVGLKLFAGRKSHLVGKDGYHAQINKTVREVFKVAFTKKVVLGDPRSADT